MKGFIILGTQRSGTTMLVNSLNKLEGITCFGEILTEKVPGNNSLNHWQPEMIKQRKQKQDNCFGKWLQDNPNGQLHDFLDYTFSKDKIVGIKMLYEHLKKRWNEIEEYINKRDIKILYIYKQNTLKQAISHKLKKSEEFKHKVEVDADWAYSKAEKLDRMNEELYDFASNYSFLPLVYENITQDREIDSIPSDISSQILEFLEYEIPVKVKKHWPSKLEDRITNYEEFIK